MEEVEFEWILEGYLQPTLAGLKVFLKCQTFSFLFAYVTVVISLSWLFIKQNRVDKKQYN